MTKRVRIENADSSNHKVVVQVWRTAAEGEPDVLVEERNVNNPADLAEVYIHSTQYIKVIEAPTA